MAIKSLYPGITIQTTSGENISLEPGSGGTVAIPSLANSSSLGVDSSGNIVGGSGPSRNITPDANTLIEWTYDEATIAYANHGTGSALSMGSTFGTAPLPAQCGILGGAVLCKGNGGVTTGDTSLNEPTGSAFTISIWFKPRQLVNNAIIFNKAYHSGGTWTSPFTSLWISTATASGETIPWSIGIAFSGSLIQTTPTGLGYLIKPEVWNFLVATYDGANLRTYHNGNLATTNTQTGSVDWGTHGPYDIGGVSNSGGLGSYCEGWVDDLRIENTTRSAAYIAAMYQTAMYGSVD